MPVYYPESMGDPTPSALGSEPAGPRAFDPDQREPGRVASADPPDASPADAGAAVADIAFSHLVSTSDAARGTPDVLAERECRLDPATRELIKRQGLGALAAAPIRLRGAVVGSLVIQASERIVALALRSIGGRYARVYRIASSPTGPAAASRITICASSPPSPTR